MKKLFAILTALVFLVWSQASAFTIYGAPEGARTGAQMNSDSTLAFPLDDQTNDYYATLESLLDWMELQSVPTKLITNYTNNDLATAISSIGSTETTLIINQTPATLTANVTFPSTLHVIQYRGCVIDGAYTVTFNGAFNAGLYRCFGNSVTVSGTPKIRVSHPKWFGAVNNGSDNDLLAIEKAATFHSQIYLPKNTLCLLDGSGSWTLNSIPNDLVFIGQDWESVVFESDDETNDFISVGEGTILYNVAFYSAFGESIKASIPGGVNIPLPVRFFSNDSPVAVSPSNYYKHHAQVHFSEAGEDLSSYSIINNGIGDSIWIGLLAGGAGLRIGIKEGQGVYIPLGSTYEVSADTFAILLKTVVDNPVHADAHLLYIEPATDHIAIEIKPLADTTKDIDISTGTKTAGSMINMFQNVSTFAGDGIIMNFGYDDGDGTSALFTGNFIKLQKDGVDRFQVNEAGAMSITSFFEASEISDPDAPAANKGRLYFRDNGGGKTQLVVRFPTGAVQVIATEP